jgi:putative oxygen-independent coproporphyrinogen III oxidase
MSTLATSLYIHMPWCVKKCPYCDFNSHQQPRQWEPEQYIDALLLDLDQELAARPVNEITSIFIGGGTPSLFHAEHYARLFKPIRERLVGQREIEITLEANPGTVEHDLFSAYREIGINRISLGVQSFDETVLKRLGRIHAPQDVTVAVAQLHEAGFKCFNLDIMHGLPGQTPAMALKDLQCAIACQPSHISWYQLTIEPNTLFAAKPPQLPDESVLEAIETQGFAYLAQQGFERYEISAFARLGHQCQHNMNYWGFGDYIGIGAGAHGKWTCPKTHRVQRVLKYKHPRIYLNAADKVQLCEPITPEDLSGEFMLNVCRLLNGFTAASFRAATGLAIEKIAPQLAQAQHRGLLQYRQGHYQPTPLGMMFHNDLVALFLTGD